MLNVIELEQRWFKYKVRSFIPYIIAFLLALIIIFILLFLSFKEDVVAPIEKSIVVIEEPIKIKKAKKHIIVKEIEPVKVIEAPVTSTIVQKQTTQNKSVLKLSPSLDFMKNLQNSEQIQYSNEKLTQEQEIPTNTPKEKEIVTPILPIKKISIKRQNTQNDIYEIITRFKKSNNPALSLFVAKKYYEMGDYKQSYNYALITNSINKNIESSWIIFSKSLVKLGKKEQAIRTLQKYVNQSHSNSAKVLLDEIKLGKF